METPRAGYPLFGGLGLFLAYGLAALGLAAGCILVWFIFYDWPVPLPIEFGWWALAHVPLLIACGWFLNLACQTPTNLDTGLIQTMSGRSQVGGSLPRPPGSSLPYLLPSALGGALLGFAYLDPMRVEGRFSYADASIGIVLISTGLLLGLIFESLRVFLFRMAEMAGRLCPGLANEHESPRKGGTSWPLMTVALGILVFSALVFFSRLALVVFVYGSPGNNHNPDGNVLWLFAPLVVMGLGIPLMLLAWGFDQMFRRWREVSAEKVPNSKVAWFVRLVCLSPLAGLSLALFIHIRRHARWNHAALFRKDHLLFDWSHYGLWVGGLFVLAIFLFRLHQLRTYVGPGYPRVHSSRSHLVSVVSISLWCVGLFVGTAYILSALFSTQMKAYGLTLADGWSEIMQNSYCYDIVVGAWLAVTLLHVQLWACAVAWECLSLWRRDSNEVGLVDGPLVPC